MVRVRIGSRRRGVPSVPKAISLLNVTIEHQQATITGSSLSIVIGITTGVEPMLLFARDHGPMHLFIRPRVEE